MSQRSTVGVLVPYVGGFYFASLLRGVRRVAEERGARVVAFQTTGLELEWPAEPETLPLGWERIDGWVGVNDQQGRAYYERIAAAGKPLVTISTRLAARGCCAVLPENQGSVEQVVAHLVEHGHTRIAFAGPLNHTDVRERYDGYLAGLRAAGIPLDSSLLYATASPIELDGRAAGKQLVAARLPCTAVVAGTDLNAIGILHEVRAAGYRVPEDLAIVGFDDIERAQSVSPPLATVRLPFDALAVKATEALLARVLDGEPLPELIRVPAQFVPRTSCGCARRPERSTITPGRVIFHDGDDTTRVAPVAQALVDVIASGRVLGAKREADVRPAATVVATHALAALRGDAGQPSDEVAAAWQALMTIAHDAETVESAMSFFDDIEAARHPCGAVDGAREGEGDDRARRGRASMRQLRLELMRAWRIVEQTRGLESKAESNRKIDLALIGTDLARTQELSWLRWANVRYGALCEWRQATSTAPRRLRVRSEFHGHDPNRDPLGVLGSEHSPAAFPSAEICAMLDEPGNQDILSIVPVTGRGQSRGLLTVIGPIDNEISDDMGHLAQWAALLGAAMDREQLLASLRGAFEREREFADTLRRSEERYALAALGANDGLWDWDVVSGRVYYSPRWKAMLGYEEDEIGADIDAWLARVHEADLLGLRQALEAPLGAQLGGRNTHVKHEYRINHKDGRTLWILCRGVVVFGTNGKPVRVAGSQTDVTGRKEAEEQLRRNALYDSLTGLPNRSLLLDRLEQAIARARRAEQSRFAVLFLDLDHFKNLNDSLGHLAGDQLLIQIAHRLGECVRGTDTVARLGGDEFAIIVTDLESEAAASLVADRIHEALRAPFDIGEHRVFTSASVGITLSSDKRHRAADFLRDGDTAMYRAKSQGRARHQLFDGRMHEQAMERLSVEAGIRRALEQDEFVLYYQPIVSLETGTISGLEALIRWQHPERGVLAPGAFLPVAEESGLLLQVSEWVLRAACEQASRWQRELVEPVRVSVNLPAQELRDARLVARVRDNMARTGLKPAGLGLELVESSLIENSSVIVDNLRDLRAMGVHIAIDDFGTGYSSLSYLKRLPLDALKIDRSFTQGIPWDTNDTAISTTIVAMARSLNLVVVAEGVETREQSEYLRAHGCHAAQGYFFSRPIPADEVWPLLRPGRHQARLPTRPAPAPSRRATPYTG